MTTPVTAQDSLNVRFVGSYGSLLERGNDLAALDNTLFVAGTGGLTVFDATNPDSLVVRSTMFAGGNVIAIDIADGFGAVLEAPDHLHVLDLQDPMRPLLRGSFDGIPLALTSVVEIWGDNIAVTDSMGQLVLFYLYGPSGPDFRARLESTSQIISIAAAGEWAYAFSLVGDMYVINRQSPYAVEMCLALMPQYVRPQTYVTIYDSYLVLSNTAFSSSRIYSLIDPRNPTYLFDVLDWGDDITFSGPIAYSIQREVGLRILDFSNPPFPNRIGETTSTCQEVRVAHAGQTAFVLSEAGGIWVVNCSDPDRPSVIDYVGQFADQARDIEVENNVAYVANFGGGFAIVDVQDAAQYARIALVPSAFPVTRLAAHNGRTLTIDSDGLFQLFDVREPAAPQTLYDARIRASDLNSIALGDSFAFVAAPTGVFNIIDVRDTTRIRSSQRFHNLHVNVNDVSVYATTVTVASSNAILRYEIVNRDSIVNTGSLSYSNEQIKALDQEGRWLCALSESRLLLVDMADYDHWDIRQAVALPPHMFNRIDLDYPYCAVSGPQGTIVYDIRQSPVREIGHYFNESRFQICAALDSNFLYSAYDYAMECRELIVPTSAPERRVSSPSALTGLSFYPNPFNGTGHVVFELTQPERVSLDVYDIGGRRVKTIASGMMQTGSHRFQFHESSAASGTYFVQAATPGHSIVQEIHLIR